MLKTISRPFKMSFGELGISTISIAWKCFAMFLKAINLIKQPRCLTILHALFITGCIDWDQGLGGLQDTPRSGRPARLSQMERERLRQDLLHSPRELGYDQNLWDGVLLSHHLAHKYSVT